MFARAQWLELSLDYRCNLRCLGCRACEGGDEALTPPRALSRMQQARAAGLTRLWLGGGEPTLRPELLPLIRAARSLGFVEVLLQTNGMRLAYPSFTRALADAGLTSVRLNLKSADPQLHDTLCQVPGAHALLDRALDALAPAGLSLLGDVLLTHDTAPGLAATVARYAARGVRVFSLWMLSAHDSPDPAVRAQVPSIRELHPHLAAAHAAAPPGVIVETLHTPWCTLPSPLRPLYRPAADWGLVVVDPSDRPFSLDASPMEGGAYLPTCDACARRPGCPGPRADYVAIHGSDEFQALATES